MTNEIHQSSLLSDPVEAALEAALEKATADRDWSKAKVLAAALDAHREG